MIREPAPMGEWSFERCVFLWSPGLVEIRFHDGARSIGDHRDAPPDRLSWFADVARKCGYESVHAYQVHHDFCHCWLPERLWRIASPTLWATSHNEPPPPINRSEEYLVNTVQWVLATGNREYRAEFLRQLVGDDFALVLDDLERDLGRLANPM